VGRLKKYFTLEEKKEAAKVASKKYYWKNKSRIDNYMKNKYKNNKKDGNSLSTSKKG
jgi:hypothetical protein